MVCIWYGTGQRHDVDTQPAGATFRVAEKEAQCGLGSHAPVDLTSERRLNISSQFGSRDTERSDTRNALVNGSRVMGLLVPPQIVLHHLRQVPDSRRIRALCALLSSLRAIRTELFRCMQCSPCWHIVIVSFVLQRVCARSG